MNHYTVNGFVRVSKARARKLWGQGVTVYACPCKLRPGAPWHVETAVHPVPRANLDTLIIPLLWYSCCNAETGRYLAFYVRQEATP